MESNNISVNFSGSESDESRTPTSSSGNKIYTKGRHCAAYGCHSRQFNPDKSSTGIKFFKFPQVNPEKQVWCNLIKCQDGRDNFKVTNTTYICIKHFKDDDIKKNPCRWTLVEGARPSLHLFQQSFSEPPPSSRKPPTPRQNPPARKKIKYNSDASVTISSFSNTVKHSNGKVSIGTQTDFSYVNNVCYFPNEKDIHENYDHPYSVVTETANDLANLALTQPHLHKKIEMQNEKIVKLEKEIQNLNNEIENFKNNYFSLNKIKDDDGAIKFYTGFPNYSCLLAFFEYLLPKVQNMHYWRGKSTTERDAGDFFYRSTENNTRPGPQRKLSFIDEFFLVLLRLKVGLFVNDLSDRFNISPTLVSRIFTTWINLLYLELPLILPFPSQSLVRKQMPKEFKDYPTTRIIIDCTEIFIEKPSSLKSQSLTWSQYKHHNTLKALVGISPNGLITFVSKLWAGRVTDKTITKESGVLEKLDSGDNVMADRGFDIHDILPEGVTLNIPPFKGSRSQLTGDETEETARIASVRIHVERAIGRVKNYHILEGVMPLSLTKVADQVFTVCCYLTNFLPPLLPSGEE